MQVQGQQVIVFVFLQKRPEGEKRQSHLKIY